MRLSVNGWGLVAGVLLGLTGCASTPPAPVAQVPALNVTEPLADVAATYVTTHTDHAARPMEWRFFREANRVEVEDLATQTGELWQRDGATRFFLKIFHADKSSIEYRMDDLQILGVSASWPQHGLLVDPAVLQQLQQVEAGWRDGYPFRRLQGEVKGEAVEIIWRVDLNLPVRIKRGHDEVTELKSAYPLAQSPWQRRDMRAYQVIDFADLGDRESDPFVMRVLSQLPGGQVHHH